MRFSSSVRCSARALEQQLPVGATARHIQAEFVEPSARHVEILRVEAPISQKSGDPLVVQGLG
jgi:hypothetical protein